MLGCQLLLEEVHVEVPRKADGSGEIYNAKLAGERRCTAAWKKLVLGQRC